jgi:hypothetical protein
LKTAISVELLRYLDQNHIPYSIVTETGTNPPAATPELARKREQLEAVKRWFYHDWRRIEPKLRTSILEDISVCLSLLDDNPSVKAPFRPPPLWCSDAALFTTARTRQSVHLNFTVAINFGLARTMNPDEAETSIPPVLNRILLMALDQLVACGDLPSLRWKSKLRHSGRVIHGDKKFFALAVSHLHSHCRHLVHLLSTLDLAKPIVADIVQNVPKEKSSWHWAMTVRAVRQGGAKHADGNSILALENAVQRNHSKTSGHHAAKFRKNWTFSLASLVRRWSFCGAKGAFTPAVILFITLPEAKDNIDPG